MQAQWTIQLDSQLYGCLNQKLLIYTNDVAQYATDAEQIEFLNNADKRWNFKSG